MAWSLFKSGEHKSGFFDRLKQTVSSTKAQLVDRIEAITEGRESIDESALDDLEVALISGDLGVKTTTEIMEGLRTRLQRREIRTAAELRPAIEQEIFTILENRNGAGKRREPAGVERRAGLPEVIFVVGVNGVGKTTTIAKLARMYLDRGAQPLLAAADTFRAAANEQLEIWAGRLGVEIVSLKPGADPAAVLYDALGRAKKQGRSHVI